MKNGIHLTTLNGWGEGGGFFGGGGGGGLFPPPPPPPLSPSKICHTYSAIKKLGTIISDLKKTQKIYESLDALLLFC